LFAGLLGNFSATNAINKLKNKGVCDITLTNGQKKTGGSADIAEPPGD
jgi:hypothetical protein